MRNRILENISVINHFRSTTNLPDSPNVTDNQQVSEENDEGLSTRGTEHERTPHRAQKRKQSPFEMAVLKYISKEKPFDEEVEADKNCLLSFLPMFKKLPVERKLWVRMKMTEIVQQAMIAPSFNPTFPTPVQPPHFSNQFQAPNFQNFPPPYQYNHPEYTTVARSDFEQPSTSSSQVFSPTPSNSESNPDVFSEL